jgi:6-phosphogluconolactonase
MKVIRCQDAEEVAARAAEAIATAVTAARATRGVAHLCLTGGTTPRRCYQLLGPLMDSWEDVHLWYGDERCVPPEDPESNARMAREALGADGAVEHRMRGELGPEAGAAQYDEELGSLRRFDLLLLGLGSDGHIASLYPNQPTLDESDRRTVGAEAKLQPFVDRISLTLPMLRAADEVLFLVAGADKAEAAQRAFASEPSPATPGSLVRADGGRTVAVLDVAAASLL